MSATITFSPESECLGKRSFASKQQAKKVARISETRFGGGPFQPYRCSHCSWWHTGHRPHPDAVAARLTHSPATPAPLATMANSAQ